MSTNKTKQIIEIVTKGAKKSKKQLKGVEGAMGGMAKKALVAGASFFAARGIINGMQESVKLAGKMKTVEQAFDKMGKKAGLSGNSLNKLRKSVNGTVSDLDLMTKANNAMALGLVQSDEQMADLFDTAQRLGAALGQDTEAALDSLVTGMGRQCLTGDSLVLLDDSTTKKITDIKKGDIVLSYHKEKGFITTKVSHLLDNGTQPVYELICEDSKKIKSTDNHRYLTDEGWKELKDIKKGNLILNNNGKYSKVKEINYLKEEQVYDLTVPETENFFANGLCVHNSKLMLDNLGIMLDTEKAYEDYAEELGKSASALDDNEKKIAFNNAAMKEAKRLVNEMGDEQITAADKMSKMNAQMANASAEMGEVFAPIIADVATWFAKITTKTAEFFTTMKNNDLENIIADLDKLENQGLAGVDVALINTKEEVINLEQELKAATNDFRFTVEALGEGAGALPTQDVIDFFSRFSDSSKLNSEEVIESFEKMRKQMGSGLDVVATFPFQDLANLTEKELQDMIQKVRDSQTDVKADNESWLKSLEAVDPNRAFQVRSWKMYQDLISGATDMIDENGNIATFHAGKQLDILRTEKEFRHNIEVMMLKNGQLEGSSIEAMLNFFAERGLSQQDFISDQIEIEKTNANHILILEQMLLFHQDIQTKKENIVKLEEKLAEKTKEKNKEAGNAHKEEAKQLGILQRIKERYDKINSKNTRKAMIEELQTAQADTTAWLIKAIMKAVPFPLNLVLAATAEAQVSELFSKLGNVKKAQYGADFIADSPQLMMVGEGSGAERVQVTPLVDPNLEGTQSEGITLNISGNVLHESFVEDNVVPQIREALRMGENLGV